MSFESKPFNYPALPERIYYQWRSLPANTIYPKHSHPYGEFVFSFSGVLEMQDDTKEIRVPPNFGLWYPAHRAHFGKNCNESEHCSLYIEQALAEEVGMPEDSCALLISPMLKAIFEHLRHSQPTAPYSTEQNRLLQVVLDQLVTSQIAGSYVPDCTDPVLNKFLKHLKQAPDISSSLAVLAKQLGTTERTIARKAKKELGMTIGEWRQRLIVMHSIPILQSGASVESVALELGYSSASAFIAMFKRLLNATPDEYRKNKIHLT